MLIFAASIIYTCPEQWTLYQGICLKIMNVRKNFEDFRKECHNYNSEPVSIETLDKEIAIIALLNQYREYWIGLYNPFDDNNRNHFQWKADGTFLSQANYSNWYRTEPSQDGPCIVISKKNSVWQWYDRNCNYRYRFICQKGN